MKRTLAAFALLLLCLFVVLPAFSAFAEGEGITDGEIDYSKFTARLDSLTDGEGNRTNAFSTGLSCGANGYTLYTGRDYSINIIYTANDSASTEQVPVAELEIIDCDPAMKEKYLSIENGSVKVKAGNDKYSFKVLLLQNGKSTEQAVPFNVASHKLELNDILLLGIGAYALLTAITGSGSMLRNEFVKDGMEDKFKKTVRIASAVVGVAVIGVAVISIFCTASGKLNWLKYVLLVVAVGALIAALILANKMTDKEKRAKAQATARTGGPTNSAAAFEFDDDEPTIDDVLAKINNENASDNNGGQND